MPLLEAPFVFEYLWCAGILHAYDDYKLAEKSRLLAEGLDHKERYILQYITIRMDCSRVRIEVLYIVTIA